MARSLNEPNGTEILAVLNYGPDEAQPWTASAIDAHRATEQTASIPYLATVHVRGLFDDPDQLDALTEWPFAWRAVRLICLYEFFAIDRNRAKARGKDCEPHEAYAMRMKGLLQMICQNFQEAGIREASKYCLGKFDLITIEVHNVCD